MTRFRVRFSGGHGIKIDNDIVLTCYSNFCMFYAECQTLNLTNPGLHCLEVSFLGCEKFLARERKVAKPAIW
jgi:hypothetical protein